MKSRVLNVLELVECFGWYITEETVAVVQSEGDEFTDESFCSCEGEESMEAGNVYEAKEGCFMCFSKEWVWSKMTSIGCRCEGRVCSVTIDGEGEVVGGFCQSYWSNDDDFHFVIFQFEGVGLEPGFYFNDAVCRVE